MTTLDRLRANLHAALIDCGDPCLDVKGCTCADRLADAALSTLAEPDEGMVEAGYRAACNATLLDDVPPTPKVVGASFTAMIDHVRKDGK